MEEEEAAGEAGKLANERGRSTPVAKRWGSALDSFLLVFIIVVTLAFQVRLFFVSAVDALLLSPSLPLSSPAAPLLSNN